MQNMEKPLKSIKGLGKLSMKILGMEIYRLLELQEEVVSLSLKPIAEELFVPLGTEIILRLIF